MTIKLNATKVCRERVDIELSELELISAVKSNLSNKAIVQILKERVRQEIIRTETAKDRELQRQAFQVATSGGAVNYEPAPPVASLSIDIERGMMTKVSRFLNSDHKAVRIPEEYMNVIRSLNEIGSYGLSTNEY
ncbi:hypothetical protein KNT87_gp023 [Erwinia phage Cronus]|uniref:Uncharacterized protein n=1 Tax=Erwinia phage Cronus TaxID=2163633 RepID=A0A2S1GM53_9CAUD|nr:hypothetical protein KNT87_gp023 [Erwinia phage Cronus]AWD90462.1 hypothetical protein [Erwinia phage Cronus]